MGRRRRDNAESAVKRKKLYPLPNGEKVEIGALGLKDYVQAREEALTQYRRTRIQAWTKNLDLLDDLTVAERQGIVQDAFARAEVEDLPVKSMKLPIRGKGGRFLIKDEQTGELLTKTQEVEYTAWWMSDTPEGRLFMTWLSIRRAKPDFTLEQADEIFRNHVEELESIADAVGDISGPKLGNSSESTDAAEPSREKETPEEKRARRRRRKRRTGR